MNIGLGCHSLLQGIFPTQGSNLGLLHCRQSLNWRSHQGIPNCVDKKSECVSLSVMSNSVWPRGLQPARLFCPWNSPGKNTGVGSHSLLQGIFPTQGLNLHLPHCRQILYSLNHVGSRQQMFCVLFVFIFWPARGMGDLSSATRDRSYTPFVRSLES